MISIDFDIREYQNKRDNVLQRRIYKTYVHKSGTRKNTPATPG